MDDVRESPFEPVVCGRRRTRREIDDYGIRQILRLDSIHP